MSLLLRALFPTFLLSGIVPLRYGFFPLSLFFCCEDYLQESLGLFFSVLGLGILPLSSLLLDSMVDSSEVRILCPSISFLFARLEASLGVSHSFCPLVENFVFEGSGLSLVLADLLPLLRQLINWFKDLVGERRVMSEVRSSELDTGLSSSDKAVEVDTAVLAPPSLNPSSSSHTMLRAFHALKEKRSLDEDTLVRFRGRF